MRSTVRLEPGGRFLATQVTLRELIRRAYDLPDSVVVGGPAWLASERFDVLARHDARDGVNEEQLRAMLRSLMTETRRPVLDETGLSGTFDGALTFVPEPLPGLPPPTRPSPDGVSVFTALQEQFGLKLEPGRGAVEVLVIDSAERATEN